MAEPVPEPTIDLDRQERPERPLEVVFRIAVVDDDALVRRTVWCSMSDEPALQLVGEATSAASAVELARSSEPDLMVLDNQMEGMTTGAEVAPRLKAVQPALRIVMFSSDPAVDAGASVDSFVRKPNFQLLLPTVRLLLRLPLTERDVELLGVQPPG